MAVHFLKVASTIGLSSLKHTLGGVPLAAGYGFSYWEVACYSAIGGILGIVLFMSLSQVFGVMFRKWFPRKKPKRKFTRANRIIIKVKRNFGLPGIAFVTPWMLSVPLGTVISTSMYRDKRRVFAWMAAGVVFWSFAGAAIAQPIASLFTA